MLSPDALELAARRRACSHDWEPCCSRDYATGDVDDQWLQCSKCGAMIDWDEDPYAQPQGLDNNPKEE